MDTSRVSVTSWKWVELGRGMSVHQSSGHSVIVTVVRSACGRLTDIQLPPLPGVTWEIQVTEND